jgi:hypothetical protein
MRPSAKQASKGATALAVWALCATPTLAAAQRAVMGSVTEEDTGAPIETARVVLADTEGRALVVGLTDHAGHFAMRHPGPGTYEVTADRIGYVPVTATITLNPGVSANLDITAYILAVEIEGVLVEATERRDPMTLGYVGVAARREAGHGTFIERAEIEARKPTLATDLFAGTPSATLKAVDRSRRDVRFLTSTRVGGPDCPPTVWLDGFMVREGGDRARSPFNLTLDEILPPPASIETIEIYPGPAGLPPQFNRSAMCGVIVVWSRRR